MPVLIALNMDGASEEDRRFALGRIPWGMARRAARPAILAFRTKLRNVAGVDWRRKRDVFRWKGLSFRLL